MSKRKPSSVDEYIISAPVEAQKKLREIRAILKKVAPNASEAIKWATPVFEEKRILFSFAAFKTHINFMPTLSALEPFREELKDYTTGKDTIQFPYDKPLPEELITRIAAYRVRDVMENDAKWMTS